MSDETSRADREPLDVYMMLTAMLEQIASVAWQKLGLQPDIMTGKIEQDLAQAKVAIDVASEVAAHLEAKLDDEDRRQIQGMVRDLRINWVQKNTEVGG